METEKKDIKLGIEKKLQNTSNRIKKSRKNVVLAQKEAEEFQEIHKLLESTDDESLFNKTEFSPRLDDSRLECSSTPLNSAVLNIFNEDSLFLFFNANSLSLSKFVEIIKNDGIIFEQNFTEEYFRDLLAHKALDTSIIEEKAYSTVGLYIFYLASVHEDADFLRNCFDFLTVHPFHIQISDIVFILTNLGAASSDDLVVTKEIIERKKIYFEDNNVGCRSKKAQFPVSNIKMVGQLLLHFVTENLVRFNSETEDLVKVLVRIPLDSKIRSNSLSSIYSSLLSLVCVKIGSRFDLNKVADWLSFDRDNLPVQLEICRAIPRPVVPDLHEILVLKTIQNILKCDNIQTPLTFSYVKSILNELKKNLLPLEIYIILQLINYSLPGLTATKEDFVETNGILAHIDRKVSQTEDSVDLIRLKLEIAKIRLAVADLVEDESSTANDSLVAPSDK